MESTARVLRMEENGKAAKPKETVTISRKGCVFKRAWANACLDDGTLVSIAAKKGPFSVATYKVKVEYVSEKERGLHEERDRRSKEAYEAEKAKMEKVEAGEFPELVLCLPSLQLTAPTDPMEEREWQLERLPLEPRKSACKASGRLIPVIAALTGDEGGRKALQLIVDVSQLIGDKIKFVRNI